MQEVLKAYRKLGCKVHCTNGAWDLTVQWGGCTDLVEVKAGAKPPSARKLTDAETKLHDNMMIRVVLNLDQVAVHVASLRRRSGALIAMPA